MKAFTIIELLISISIIGILSLISLPVYKTLLPNINLNSVTRDVASDLRYAQQMSVTEQINYSVIFDKDFNRYSIKKETGEIVRSETLRNDVKINSVDMPEANQVVFNATGAATQTGSISFINLKGTISTIEIKPSGYVKIQQ